MDLYFVSACPIFGPRVHVHTVAVCAVSEEDHYLMKTHNVLAHGLVSVLLKTTYTNSLGDIFHKLMFICCFRSVKVYR